MIRLPASGIALRGLVWLPISYDLHQYGISLLLHIGRAEDRVGPSAVHNVWRVIYVPLRGNYIA